MRPLIPSISNFGGGLEHLISAYVSGALRRPVMIMRMGVQVLISFRWVARTVGKSSSTSEVLGVHGTKVVEESHCYRNNINQSIERTLIGYRNTITCILYRR